jgi:hypothetical protein
MKSSVVSGIKIGIAKKAGMNINISVFNPAAFDFN